LRFEQDFLRIGIKANLPGVNEPEQDKKELVKSWLNSKDSGTWLIIVDNADDIDVFFKRRGTGSTALGSKRLIEFLPQCSNGSILFTTRNKKAGIKFATPGGVLDLPEMDPMDAEKLLKASLDKDILDSDGISELLRLLDYLPLAISQAGSYIAENSISISQYLQIYNESESSRIELLSEDFEDLARDPDTKNPVAATWEISFGQIRQSDILAADLLSFMACLDRQDIPVGLLPLSPTEGLVRTSKALGLLKAYSLITSKNDLVFDMHRLVYLATRNWLRLNGTFGDWAKRCLTLVSDKFPPGEHGTLDTCDLYLPHAQAILSYEGFSTADNNSRARLAHKVSYYLRNRGLFAPAHGRANQAVQWRQMTLGSEHLDTLASVDNLARVLHLLGSYEEAQKMQRRVLELREKVLGPEHPDTLASMNNLARVLFRQGKFDEATEGMYRRVLELRTKVLGPEHPDTLASMNNLAQMLHRQGKHNNVAEEMHRRVLELRTKVLGPEHPKVLASMNNLALALWDRDKHEAAEAVHRQVLELRKKVLGLEHPDTLASMDNLAIVLHRQGKCDDVTEEMYQRVLELRTKVLGPKHPNTLASMNNLALVLWDRDKHQAAEEMHRRVLDLRVKVLGLEHPDTQASMDSFELALQDRGKSEAAEVRAPALELSRLTISSHGLSSSASQPIQTMDGLQQDMLLWGQLGKKSLDSGKEGGARLPTQLSTHSSYQICYVPGAELSNATSTNNMTTQEMKRRRRRESHNLVERRRRDKFNMRILDLHRLAPTNRIEALPDDSTIAGIPTDEEYKVHNKGDTLNAAVSWTRDLMLMLQIKLRQQEELRKLIEDLGGEWPFEITEEEKRMHTELMDAFEGSNTSSFMFSRPPDSELLRAKANARGRKHKYETRSLSASDASNS
jgi:tetratricopeptide (TPR) repeat protein